MATFTPPTHTEYFAPAGADRLWSRVPYQRGQAALVTAGEVTTFPGVEITTGDSVAAADQAFGGGGIYTDLDIDTEQILAGAGYDQTITNETWPGWV